MTKKINSKTSKAKIQAQTQLQLNFLDSTGETYIMKLGVKGKEAKVLSIKKLEPPAPETYPSEGVNKYYVAHHKLGIYTTIGANNIHHAANKATKLFGPHWSFLRDQHHTGELVSYQFLTVAKFNTTIKTLSI